MYKLYLHKTFLCYILCYIYIVTQKDEIHMHCFHLIREIYEILLLFCYECKKLFLSEKKKTELCKIRENTFSSETNKQKKCNHESGMKKNLFMVADKECCINLER